MTNDPKQAKTILGWLPQSPLSSSPAAQPAEGTAPVPETAQSGYAGSQAQPPHASGFPPHASSPGYPGAQPSPGFHGAQQAAGFPGAQQPAGYSGAHGHAPGFPGAQQSGGFPGAQQSGGFPGAQQSGGFPGAQQSAGYPGAQPSAGYPGTQQSGGYPGTQQSGGFPGAQQSAGFPGGGYPGAQQSAGYPGAQPNASGFPGAQQSSGFPGAQAGYPGVQQSAGFPGAQQPPGFPGAQAGYPGVQQSAGFPGAQANASGFPGAGQQHAYGHASPGAASNMQGVGGFAGGGTTPSESTGSSSLRDRANATEGVSDRTRFIRLTYLHLLGAILVFAGLEYLLMTNAFLIEKVSAPFVVFAIGGRWNWGVVLAAFMVVSWIADYWASHTTSRPLQYVGLGFYVVAEAVIFVPLLAIVQWKTAAIIARGGGDPNIIRDAAFTTLAIFGALTASVFVTKKDFSFLRTGLMMASAAAMMLVILSLVFGFNLGIVFSIAMVLLAAGYILFQTSQILAHYDPRNHVAAALALFSSVALMFWYVIRIFMRMRE